MTDKTMIVWDTDMGDREYRLCNCICHIAKDRGLGEKVRHKKPCCQHPCETPHSRYQHKVLRGNEGAHKNADAVV